MTGQKKIPRLSETVNTIVSPAEGQNRRSSRAKDKPNCSEDVHAPVPSLSAGGRGRPGTINRALTANLPKSVIARRKPVASVIDASHAVSEGSQRAAKPRREQKRAIETKQAILGAALQEFARKGFDAASIRDIADRLGIQHPLITYHYKTKEVLWQAVAEQIVSEVKEDMDSQTSGLENVKPLDRVRAEFRALLHIQHKYPDFHYFMLNESREKGPRLQWLAENVLAPMVNQNLPEIRRAQATGDLPAGEPVLLHYMLIGMTSALMSLGAEIDAVTGYSIDSPGIEDVYFDMIDQIMFKRKFNGFAESRQVGGDGSAQLSSDGCGEA